MTRISLAALVRLNTYWVGLSFMWNSLHVIILPAVLLRFVPDNIKNTALGLLTFGGLLIAMIVQPVSGAVSDQWRSRFGRRRPLIVLGTALDVVFLGIMATARDVTALGVGYIGLQFTSNIAHGPAQGLMHDRVPSGQMGMASGVKNFLDMAGMVISSLCVGRLLSPDSPDAAGTFAWVAAVLLLGATVTVLGTGEQPSREASLGVGTLDRLRALLRLDIRAHPGYWRLILGRLLFLVGIYGVQAFAQYYVRDMLRTDNPIKLTGDLMATIALALIAFSLVAGILCDRFGRRPMHVAAAALVAVGSLLMMAARTSSAVLAFGSIVGAGLGIFITANWALANDLAPAAEAGKFLGLTNLATAGAAAISRLTGPAIDALNAWHPGENLGYVGLFAGAAVLALASLAPIRGLPDQKTPQAACPGQGYNP